MLKSHARCVRVDRWEPYTPIGDQITGTRFISFKVPLKLQICRAVKEEFWFTPQNLIEQVRRKGLELGLVIDLTNTDRYYPGKAITEQGVNYVKIMTEGHVIPNAQVMERFYSTVDTFLEENQDNDKLIGVHCTHGVNRTGYIVCKYMIDKLNFNPEDAIEAFNEARGHRIERENYLCALNGGTPEQIAALEKKHFAERGKEREIEQRERFQPKSDWRGRGRGGQFQQHRNYNNDSYGYHGNQWNSQDGYRGNSRGGRVYRGYPRFRSRPYGKFPGYNHGNQDVGNDSRQHKHYNDCGYRNNQVPSNQFTNDNNREFKGKKYGQNHRGSHSYRGRPRFETVTNSYETSSGSTYRCFQSGVFQVSQLEANIRTESASYRPSGPSDTSSYGEQDKGKRKQRTVSGGSDKQATKPRKNKKGSKSKAKSD